MLVSYAKLMQLHEVSIRVSRPQQGVVDAEARAIMAPIRLGRLHESTAALHGGVAAALTAALMPCRTIPRLAAVPALSAARSPLVGGAPSWAPHPCPLGDEARGRTPRLYGRV